MPIGTMVNQPVPDIRKIDVNKIHTFTDIKLIFDTLELEIDINSRKFKKLSHFTKEK